MHILISFCTFIIQLQRRLRRQLVRWWWRCHWHTKWRWLV